MKNILYFGSIGSSHPAQIDNAYIGVDGGSRIRFPFFKELLKRGYDITFCGFVNAKTRINPILSVFNINFYANYVNYTDKINRISPEINDILEYLHAHRFNNYTSDCAIVIELRPYLFQNSDDYNFEKEIQIQTFLIQSAYLLGIPVFVWDQDGWASMIPMNLRKNITLLTAYPTGYAGWINLEGFHHIEFFPYFYDPSEITINQSFNRFDVAYCGNVYGRRDEFYKFLKPFHDANKSVIIAGNWLRKKYNDRDFSLDNFPNFLFLGETPHWATLPILKMAKYSLHFSNPLQQQLGLITMRPFECFQAGIPVFVNEDIKGIERFVTNEQLITKKMFDKNQVVEYIESCDLSEIYNNWGKIMSRHTIENRVNQFEKLL